MARPVVFLSSRREPGREAEVDAALLAPGARIVACDPVSYLQVSSVIPTAETALASLRTSDLASLDAKEFRRLRAIEALSATEPLTGQRLGYLMARTILYRMIPLAKSLRVAEAILPDTERIILVGESAAPPGSAYASEFHDLYPVLEVLAAGQGRACERIARPRPTPPKARETLRLLPWLVRVEAGLMRVRARRVLAVELYTGVRKRLSQDLPDVSVLPYTATAPSHADYENARSLSDDFGRTLPEPSSADSDGPIEELRDRAIQEAISADLPRVLARARAMSSLLRSFRPQVVLLMEDVSPSGRFLASLARKAGAWTAVVQHGLTGEDLGGIHVMPCVAHVHCAWGIHAANWNVAHGAPPQSQVVIGNPMLDGLFRTHRSPGNDVQPQEVVFVSQPFLGLSAQESDFQRMETLRALRPFESDGVPVVIRPHPSDDLPSLERLVVGLGFARAQWDGALEKSLARPAVIVTKTSTVALEALVRGRPVVLAAFSGRGDRTGLSDHGAAILAASPEELTAGVRSCITSPAARQRLFEGRIQLLREYLDGMDGRAVQRLGEHVVAHLPAPARE